MCKRTNDEIINSIYQKETCNNKLNQEEEDWLVEYGSHSLNSAKEKE